MRGQARQARHAKSKAQKKTGLVGYLAAGGVELELRIGCGDDARLGPVGGLAAEHARLAVLARVAEGCVVQHLPGTETAIGSEIMPRHDLLLTSLQK